MPASLIELEARVVALEARMELLHTPRIVPGWGQRTCQVCGQKAEVIDTSPATLLESANGEGYCMTHAVAGGVLDGDHLTHS